MFAVLRMRLFMNQTARVRTMTLFANESSIVWAGLTGRIGGITGVYHSEGIVATFGAAPLAAPVPLVRGTGSEASLAGANYWRWGPLLV